MRNNEINDIDDLLRLLESNSEIAERVRQALLWEGVVGIA